jgi:hypothetical protein
LFAKRAWHIHKDVLAIALTMRRIAAGVRRPRLVVVLALLPRPRLAHGGVVAMVLVVWVARLIESGIDAGAEGEAPSWAATQKPMPPC